MHIFKGGRRVKKIRIFNSKFKYFFEKKALKGLSTVLQSPTDARGDPFDLGARTMKLRDFDTSRISNGSCTRG